MTRLVRFERRLSRLAAQAPVRFSFFALLALVACWPYLRTAGVINEFRDALVLWSYEDSARRTVTDFGQLPLWNPWYCGGLYGLGSPQARFASPPFLLSLLFGTTRAEALLVFAAVIAALEGAWRYLRARAVGSLGAFLAAPAFGLGGIFALAPTLGWHNFLGFALLPWALWGVRRAGRGDLVGAVIAAGSLAWMVGFGGTYVAPISAMACLLEGLLIGAARPRRTAWGVLALAAVLGVGLSAARLWPIYEELQRAPRVVAGTSGIEPGALVSALFGYTPVFTLASWYLVGLFAGCVALLGLWRRKILSAAIATGFWCWLALGYWAKPSLYGLLRASRTFAMLRAPERFLIPVILLVALAAGWAVTQWAARQRARRFKFPRLAGAVLVVALVGLTLNLAVLVNNFRIAAASRQLGYAPEEVRRPFHQSRGNRWAASIFGPMSRGSLSCWEAYAVPQSPRLQGDLQQEAYLADPGAGSVEELAWTPNRLSYRITLARPSRLLVNQNHHRGWKTDVGAVVNDRGLLGVELPAGQHEVTLRFLPRSAVGGLSVSLLALVAAVILWRTKGLRSRLDGLRAAGLVLVPLLLGAGLAASSDEPPLVRELLTPEGEPVIAEAPPPQATRFDARFGGGVWLQAVALEARDDHTIRLELDWSTTPALQPGLGFFVHLEPERSKRIMADHATVSGVLLLEDAPVGKTLRDVLIVEAPPSRRGEFWNVWVGVWALRGDGARMPVLEHPGHQVESARLHVGAVHPK